MKHYSYSQLSMYEKCGIQYRFRYIDGEIRPPGFSLIRGSGAHKAREHNLRQKIETHEDLRLDEVLDVARDSINEQWAGGVIIDDDRFEGKSAKDVKGICVDETREVVTADYGEFQIVQPVAVEEKLEMVIPGLEDRTIVSYLDTRDDNGIVHDLKVTGKKPAEADIHSDEQLTLYDLNCAANQILVSGLQWDVVVKTKTKCYTEAISTTRKRSDHTAIINRIIASIKAIESEVFVPCQPSAWWCGPKWCGYWYDCPYVIGK